MSKGFGIAALVLAILGIFVPIVSIYVVWLALILTAVAAFAGDRSLSIAAFVICLVNVLFLSPATLVEFGAKQGGSGLATFTVILFVIPLIGFIVKYKKKPLTTGEKQKSV